MLRYLGNAQQPLLGLLEKLYASKKPPLKSATYGRRMEPVNPTSRKDMESALDTLSAHAEEWRGLSMKEKGEMIQACLKTTSEVSEELATACATHKGTYGLGIGEELLSLIAPLSVMSELAHVLQSDTMPRPNNIRRVGNQWVADVFPNGYDALMFGGVRAELWISPHHGVTQAKFIEEAETETDPGVVLVLGAGNQVVLSILDILHVLVAQSRTVICKLNPVLEYTGIYLRKALKPLVDAGYVEFVYGGANEGAFIANHPCIKSVHLSGSHHTFDQLVWQGKEKVGKPPFEKTVTAELGCVSPCIVVPGDWTPEEIEYHAKTVVQGVVHNCGHNCLKTEVLVTDRSWKQREEFLDAVRRILNSMPKRTAYYPGSGEKIKNFKHMFPDAEEFGRDAATETQDKLPHFPWTFKTGLKPDEAAVSQENWCGVLQEVAIETDRPKSVPQFLEESLDFVNTKCWGTLSCVVLAKPSTQKKYAGEFEDFIAKLEYGSICINIPSLMGFGITRSCWGAYGERPMEEAVLDIGSGNCKVHNTLLLDHVQKGVVHGPWRFHPYPFWFPDHHNLEAVAKKTLKYFEKKSMGTMLQVIPAALKG